jgi:hypothetical protein
MRSRFTGGCILVVWGCLTGCYITIEDGLWRKDGLGPRRDSSTSDAPRPTDGPRTDVRKTDGPRADALRLDLLNPKTDLPKNSSCNDRYGAAPDYKLCLETATSCKFFATTNGTCTTLCGAHQGTCLDASDGNPPWVCVNGGYSNCNDTHVDQICTCTR